MAPHDAMCIVIATLNRPRWVVDLLGDLLAQRGPADEILVIDQSEPTLRFDHERWREAGVRVLVAPKRGLPAARQLGLEASEAALLLYLDDDVRLLPGAVEGHRAAHVDPRVGGVVGRIIEREAPQGGFAGPRLRVTRSGRVECELSGTEAGPVQALKGANMSFKRAALLAAGGFQSGYLGTALLEDADIAVRVREAGYLLMFMPDAGVVHLSAETGGVRVGAERETVAWRLFNTARYVRRYGRGADVLRFVLVHGLIAGRATVRARELSAAGDFARAMMRGWEAGKREPV